MVLHLWKSRSPPSLSPNSNELGLFFWSKPKAHKWSWWHYAKASSQKLVKAEKWISNIKENSSSAFIVFNPLSLFFRPHRELLSKNLTGMLNEITSPKRVRNAEYQLSFRVWLCEEAMG